MSDQTENYPSACVHTVVERFRIAKDSKVFEEQWRCKDCGTKFVSMDSLFNAPQQIQIMEPVKTLRDEFAMAALQAYITCDNSGTTFWSTAPQMVDAVNNSFVWAKTMMEARK